jgi:hypothetical protein
MFRVGFEPTTTVFARAETDHDLDSAATVIGIIIDKLPNATDGHDLEAVPSISPPHNLSPNFIKICLQAVCPQ